MKFKTFFSVALLMAVMLGCFVSESQAQNTFQRYGTVKYIKSSRDTVTLPGLSTEIREGTIVNKGPGSMEVFFSVPGGTAVDSNRYFVIDSGKSLKFKTSSPRIFRRAITDSCYSQILLGAELGSKSVFDEEYLYFAELLDYNVDFAGRVMRKENEFAIRPPWQFKKLRLYT